MSGLVFALSAVLGARILPAGDVKIDRVDYHGWPECYRMSNGIADLVYVPQIGRIMRFGYIGWPNMIWENSKLDGQSRDAGSPAKDWMNFGGDKLWPAPQDRWGWPPDPVIDAGQQEVKILPGGKLRVIGKASKKHGVRFIREITLGLGSPTVNIHNIIENTSSSVQEWAIWEVLQIKSPVWAAIPVSKTGRFKEGYFAFKDAAPVDGALSMTRGQVRVTRDSKKSSKIGSDARGGWAAANMGGRQLTLSIGPVATGRYPDSGCIQEIYTSPDPDKYMELEVLSPIRKLKPGERFALNTKLELTYGER